MNLTEDGILTLAPDEASKKAGKDLAAPAKWVTKESSSEAVWGECQGSGSKPYQTAIDLSNLAFKCSCPSRKFPCKHGVALGLLFVRQRAGFGAANPPAWVTDWLSKRAQKEEKKEDKKAAPVDEAAQVKRQQAREQKVADGVEEFLLWIKDIVRNGIINLPDKPYSYWEGTAKRMVDAQAPGLAGMVRGLGNTAFYKEGWQSGFLDALLSAYLVAKGFQNRETVSSHLLNDIKSSIGFTINQESLKEQNGIADTWLVTGKQVSEEDNLTIERHWLYGMTTKRYALVLQFLVRGQAASILLSPGMYIEAEVVYFPSAAPLRALLKRQVIGSAKQVTHLYSSWTEIAETETESCSSFPVQNERPYAVSQITPVQHNGAWWLKDSQHNMVNLKDGFAGIWKLLAISGGAPLDMVVVGKENRYEPLGVWCNQAYQPI